METIEFKGNNCFTFKANVARSPYSDKFKCLILESDTTPNYYAKGNFPPNEKQLTDKHLYLIIKNNINCFQDVIIRHMISLKDKLKLKAYPGQMTLHNADYQCIRVNLIDEEEFKIFIDSLIKLGFKFEHDKKLKPYDSLIYYKKYTEFVKIEDDVYVDKNNPNRYFFKIDGHIDFEEFDAGISKIKHKCNYHLFDSFFSYLFYGNTIYDFIGIYSKHCDQNRFKEFKTEIKKIFKH